MTDAAKVRRIIDRHNADICRAYAAGDAPAVAAHFAEDCWQLPPNSPALVGRAALEQFWSQAAQWGRWNFTIEARDVKVSGDIAVERGAYTLRFEAGPQAPPGLSAHEDAGNYVVMWRLDEDGEWRAVWDAPVSERPPAGTVPA